MSCYNSILARNYFEFFSIMKTRPRKINPQFRKLNKYFNYPINLLNILNNNIDKKIFLLITNIYSFLE